MITPPTIRKTAGVVRVGAYGDALWASSVIAALRKDGYAVTVYVATTGEEMLRHDPNVESIVTLPNGVLGDVELIEFCANESTKFDRWINLVGSVEQRLLYHPSSNEFYLPQKLRHRFGNVNYLEMIHDYADLPYEFDQRFYPSEEESAWARDAKKSMPPGPLVVVNPCGSGPAKTWPHLKRFVERMAQEHINCVVLGDVRDLDVADIDPWVTVVGRAWPIRHAMAFAQLADVVVGTESAIINSVAFEPMLKVALLSHSSNENLTKHWRNTAAIEPTGVACYPCHRIHGEHLGFCAKDTATGCAACLASITAPAVADFVVDHLTVRVAA